MSLDVQVDTSAFRAAVDMALRNTSRELSVATNARMYFLLRKALDATKRASRQDIEKLGVYRFDYYTRKGTIAKKPKLVQSAGNTMSFIRIQQAKNGEFARKFANRAALTEAAYEWTTGKFKAIGFLASLWIKAIRRFDRYAGQKLGLPVDATRNIANHENVTTLARIARPGIAPVAEARISVGADAGGVQLRNYAQGLALAAMRSAMASEVAEIERHMERKAKNACRSAGMTVR